MSVMLLSLLLVAQTAECPLPELRRALRDRAGHYQPLSATDLREVRRWWQAIGNQGTGPPQWWVEGIASGPLPTSDTCAGERGFWWLQPRPDGPATGQPLGVWRFGWQQPIVLQAPHQGSDRWTGRLARQWFEQRPVAAAFWNLGSRKLALADGSLADLARREDHLLHAAALGLAEHPEFRFVQLHGFARERAPQPVDLVLSYGQRWPAPDLDALAACLGDALGVRSATYPEQIKYLGGTTNALARALPAGRFLHLEISAELRQRLVDNDPERQRLFDCVARWALPQ